jgi:hypothetical protein
MPTQKCLREQRKREIRQELYKNLREGVLLAADYEHNYGELQELEMRTRVDEKTLSVLARLREQERTQA